MADDAQYLDVTLLDKEYRVVCAQNERDDLLAAVAYVDDKMREIAGKSRSAGNTERIAVMVAMNIAHEFLRFRIKAASVLKNSDQGLDNANILRKISEMEGKLDAVLGSGKLL
ncbi:MAG: cell division protein ZapA [Candidatus Accumulibacter sp.]|jgi:cell division protein ZapA|nr:cell division protein ZapA [Accumulibacter sp.]